MINFGNICLPKLVKDEADGFLDGSFLAVLVLGLFAFDSDSLPFAVDSILLGAVFGLSTITFGVLGTLTWITAFSAHSFI